MLYQLLPRIAEETEPFETDESAATPPPHLAYRMTARITIPEPLPVPAWSDSEVARLLAISSLPAFTISTWSSSSTPDFISHYQTSLTCIDSTTPSPIRSLAIEAATILDKSCGSAANFSSSLPFTTHPYIYPTPTDAHKPCPFSSYSLTPVLLPSANHREDRQRLTTTRRVGIALWSRYEVGESSAAAAARPAGGLRADYGFVATMDREIRRDPERYVGYGITDSWDEIVETLQGAPVSTDTELGAHVRDFESMVRRSTY
ncbi:hypothetical protein Tco_0799152 [Tanacetum coccineum]